MTANGENVAGGMGLTPSTADTILASGVDVITSGNHIWDKREIYPYLEANERVLRPLNYGTHEVPGRGWGTYRRSTAPTSRSSTSRAAPTCSRSRTRSPTRTACSTRSSEPLPPVRLVDFHCELTSEKNALGLYLDGRVSVVVGTHTHVVTGDERILPEGTAYQTDLGMTGPIWSVIGFEPRTVLPRFINALPTRFEVGEGPVVFNAVQVDIDPATGRALHRADPAPRRGLTVTDRPRRRRHDPLAAPGTRAGRAARPVDRRPPHPHDPLRRRPRAAGAGRGFAAGGGVRFLRTAPTTTPSPATATVVAAAAVPDGLTLIPGVEINAIVTRDLGLWEGELHILGFGMDPDDEAFEAALAAQRGRRRERFERPVERLRELGLPIDAQVDLLGTADDDALGRPTVARALIAAGTRRASRTRSTGSWLGPAGLRRRDGTRPDGGDPRDPRRRRPAGRWPTSARRRTRLEVLRELVEVGLGGLEVYYRVVRAAHGRRGRRGRPTPRPGGDRRHATTTATSAPTPRRTRSCVGRRPRSREALSDSGAAARP